MMTTVSPPAESAMALTRGAAVTPIDALNVPGIATLRVSTTPDEPRKPARAV